MPVTIVVRSASNVRDEDAPSLTFDGARVVIGRGTGSDVRLPDPSVSFRHATIRAQGSDYAIVDEGSSNGTFVGGVKLLPQSPRVVKSGDLVRVGRVWLEIGVGQKLATPDLGLATRDLAFALVQRAMAAVGDDTTTRVRVAEGADIGTELALLEEGRAYVIGRAEGADLMLADADASREHAVVTRRGGQVLLRDLGSRNGVFLGEQRLTAERDVVWKPPMMAKIGLTVLALDEPVTVALAALEAAEDEAMADEDVPPAPPSILAPPPPPPPPSASGAPTSARTDDAPPSQMVQGAAPIADLAEAPYDAHIESPPESARTRRRKGWTMTDLFVVTLAIGVIGASIAGLVWVLR